MHASKISTLEIIRISLNIEIRQAHVGIYKLVQFKLRLVWVVQAVTRMLRSLALRVVTEQHQGVAPRQVAEVTEWVAKKVEVHRQEMSELSHRFPGASLRRAVELSNCGTSSQLRMVAG